MAEWFVEAEEQPAGTETDGGKFGFGLRYRWDLVTLLPPLLKRQDEPIASALLEEFLISARIMVDAFFSTEWLENVQTKKNRKNKSRDGDLTVSAVGMNRIDIPRVAYKWRHAVNKRAAHLTNVSKGSWYCEPVVALLAERMKALLTHLESDAMKESSKAREALRFLKDGDTDAA